MPKESQLNKLTLIKITIFFALVTTLLISLKGFQKTLLKPQNIHYWIFYQNQL